MKKVTFLINSLTSGGAEKVLSVLITELVAQKFDVELLCIEKDLFQTIPSEVNIIYLSKLTKHDSNIKKFIYLPYLALKLKKHIKKNNIKLVQSHIYRANFINLLAKKFGAKHQAQVVEVTSINNLMTKSLTHKINFNLIKYLYRDADLVVFKAKRMQLEFLKHINYQGKHTVINNPYDIEKIKKLSTEEVTDFTFHPSKKYIIAVGRLMAIKRYETLIKSLSYLDDAVELIIIGDGTTKEELASEASSLKLSKRVHLLGRKENPFKYVKQSNLFVLSSKGEGFPNVLIEAMICETAVISTDCISGPREILAPTTDIGFQLKTDIEMAENGILYPVDDIGALVKAVNLLLHDEKLKKDYEEKALHQAQEYTMETIVNKYKEVLLLSAH